MIDLIKVKLEAYQTNDEKYNYLREELQMLTLASLDKHGGFKNIAFLDGTALRILYKIQRYSEDLDFSLVNPDTYNFELYLEKIKNDFEKRGILVDLKTRKKVGAVRSAFIKFKGLLYELGLSPLPDQNIQIKFDIDENPPLGYNTELTTLT